MPRSRVAESPKTAVETRAVRRGPLLCVLDEVGDQPALRDARLAGVDGVAEVAVGGEPDVVEHVWVDARLGGRLGDGGAVIPDAPVVGVDPGDAGTGRPERPVRVLDCEVGLGAGELRSWKKTTRPIM